MYVPILKAKRGELAAICQLTDDLGAIVLPLLECLPMGETEDLDEKVETFSAALIAAWFREKPLFLDLNTISWKARMSNRSVPFTRIHDQLDEAGMQAIPVWRTDLNASVPQLVIDLARKRQRGVCLRLPKKIFLNAVAVSGIRRDVDAFGLEPSQVDLVFDLFQITEGELVTYRDLMPMIFARVPDIDKYRSLTLASGAFPESTSVFHGPGLYELPRRDWLLWSHLATPGNQMVKIPYFGDYATVMPKVEEVDTKVMRPAAGIKYTTKDSWIVARGTKAAKRGGCEQYRSLAKQICSHEKFSGANHCAGDKRIIQCAAGEGTPGNPPSWVAPVMNHHITFAAHQVASWPAS